MKTKILFCLLVTLSVFLATEKSVADPSGALWCAKNHRFYPNEAAFIAGCEGGGGNNGGGYTGPSAAQIAAQQAYAAQQAAAAAKKQREDEAQALIQQGDDAYNQNNYETAITYFQDALDKIPDDSVADDSSLRDTIQNYIQKAKDAIAAKKQREQEAFDKSKQEGLSQLKGLAQGGNFDSGTGLKGLDSADSGLKGIDDNSSGLKTLPVNTDPMVVDARDVPTGLPKSVADSIPQTLAGDRVRKGYEAIQTHDWKAALAWFQDALNHEPGDPGLQRLVDLAQFTIQNESQTTTAATPVGLDAGKTGRAPDDDKKCSVDFFNEKLDQAVKQKESYDEFLKHENPTWQNFFRVLTRKAEDEPIRIDANGIRG